MGDKLVKSEFVPQGYFFQDELTKKMKITGEGVV